MADQASEPPKKLTRSMKNKVIAGVCGGLGTFFSIDPTLIRLIWALSIIFGGFGLLAYVIAWIVVPASKD